MEIREILKSLHIEDFIAQKTDEATEMFHHGLVEGGRSMCNAIEMLKDFMKEE